jgi:hypothetical protein
MRRFVPGHTLLSQLLVRLFVAALFSDAANLDEFVCGHLVLHDGDEVVIANLGIDHGANTPMCPVKCCSTGASGVRQSVPLSPAFVRVIIDQDSPSNAAVGFLSVSDFLPILVDSPVVSSGSQLPVELLHLRHCTLLI